MDSHAKEEREESNLVLASASPRRSELLRCLGLTFRIQPADIDEQFKEKESIAEAAKRLASLKAQSVADGEPTAWVLAADTIVVADDVLLGKPADIAEAFAMLQSLQGRAHRVVTACALVNRATDSENVFEVETTVVFKTCSDAELQAYAKTGEPLDKAGAYGIQGIGAFLVSRIEGSYTNVVGLPLAEVADCLHEHGLWHPRVLGV